MEDKKKKKSNKNYRFLQAIPPRSLVYIFWQLTSRLIILLFYFFFLPKCLPVVFSNPNYRNATGRKKKKKKKKTNQTRILSYFFFFLFLRSGTFISVYCNSTPIYYIHYTFFFFLLHLLLFLSFGFFGFGICRPQTNEPSINLRHRVHLAIGQLRWKK